MTCLRTRSDSRRPRPASWLAGLACVVLAASAGLALSPGAPLRLLPAKTWVGIARVVLEVDDLELSGAELVGRYRIRVPFAPHQDDAGLIRIRSREPWGEIMAEGGRMTGSVKSDYNGKTHAVECELEPDGDVRIVVTTDRRVLSFDTRFDGPPYAERD